MSDISFALAKAFEHLFRPRILSLILLPFLGAFIVWIGVTVYFWQDWFNALHVWVGQTAFYGLLIDFNLAWITEFLTGFVLLALLIPITLITALIIISTIAMPVMVRQISQDDFPDLELKHGAGNMDGLLNSLSSSFIYVLLWLSTLPLWIFGPFAMILPILLNAYLNKRILTYDALADHASCEEMEDIVRNSGKKLYFLGVILAFVQFIPLINLVAPIYAGLAFAYLCLAELKKLRQKK